MGVVRPLSLLLAVALLSACSAAPPPPSRVDTGAAVLGALSGEVADVATAQADADRAINAVLDVAGRMDEAVAELGETATFDDRVRRYGALHDDVQALTVDESLRQPLFAAAAAVDSARDTLAGARQVLDKPWEVAYLDAQDTLLVAVREYAATADKLAQLLIRHWPTYVQIDRRIADFATRRSNYRDTAEARDALAVELDDLHSDLVVAEQQLDDYQRRRSAAGQAVNDANADAETVYEQRPGAS